MPEKYMLRQMQALPLRAKEHMSWQRIREWYDHFNGDVCISFSGGKDSTVLAHLVHEWYPNVPMVFANTGLEYPEIQAFARKMGAEFVRPKMNFSEVISKYGYPIISKENAEAIYYARNIKNSLRGGVQEDSKSETQRTQRNSSTGWEQYRTSRRNKILNEIYDYSRMGGGTREINSWDLKGFRQTEFTHGRKREHQDAGDGG